METMEIIVTGNADRIHYQLSDETAKFLGIKSIDIVISRENLADFDFYHGDFEEKQVLAHLTGLPSDQLKDKFEKVIYYTMGVHPAFRIKTVDLS